MENERFLAANRWGVSFWRSREYFARVRVGPFSSPLPSLPRARRLMERKRRIVPLPPDSPAARNQITERGLFASHPRNARWRISEPGGGGGERVTPDSQAGEELRQHRALAVEQFGQQTGVHRAQAPVSPSVTVTVEFALPVCHRLSAICTA